MEQSEIILIGDERVQAISVKDCLEPIVDLSVEFAELRFDLSRNQVQKKSKSISMARRTVGQKLLTAQTMLPNGFYLLIKECHRPLWVQKIFWDAYSEGLRKRFPEWGERQIYDECCKMNAPLSVAPHSTGGAVDLTLARSNGDVVDMGTSFNASPLETAGATFTFAENIDGQARAHRKILADVMRKVGFVNYPTEWWHWSYGDKYWALLSHQPAAIYDSVELP